MKKRLLFLTVFFAFFAFHSMAQTYVSRAYDGYSGGVYIRAGGVDYPINQGDNLAFFGTPTHLVVPGFSIWWTSGLWPLGNYGSVEIADGDPLVYRAIGRYQYASNQYSVSVTESRFIIPPGY